MMNDRRKYKSKKKQKYKLINRKIRRKINEAMVYWLEQSCKEIEQNHDTLNPHKKLKSTQKSINPGTSTR